MCEIVDIDDRLELLQAYRGDKNMMKEVLKDLNPCDSCSEGQQAQEEGSECSCRLQYQTKLQNEIYCIQIGLPDKMNLIQPILTFSHQCHVKYQTT